MLKSSLVLILAILAGCSTPDSGKVVVDKTSSGLIKVTFCGNAYMSQKEVDKYALQRASLEALAKGCTHFAIVNKDDKSRICSLSGPEGKREHLYDETQTAKRPIPLIPKEFVEPNVTLIIRCMSDAQGAAKEAIDAKKFLEENFPENEKIKQNCPTNES